MFCVLFAKIGYKDFAKTSECINFAKVIINIECYEN